jgi:serine/threonine protein kinase
MPISTQTRPVFVPANEQSHASIQDCSSCGTRVDLSRYEPLQEISCPVCQKRMVVKGCIDRFRLDAIAGQGGTGLVYKAFDPHLGRHIALKVVRQDKTANAEVLQQMEAEAGVTASMNHPNVVRVYSVGNANGRFFIAMELVSGGSLDAMMEKQRRIPEAQVLDMAVQVAAGLKAAQQAGLVHRDIKPGNILFSDPKTAKVVDFGLAVFEQHNVAAGEVWGTPYYMPPERLQGQVEDFRADIYALGATLFHALAGRPPFEAANSTQVALKRLQSVAPSVLTYAPGVSNSTAFLIKKMLEKNPEDRFQSYDQLIESLQFARNELGSKPAAKARVVVDAEQQGKSGMFVTLATLGVLLVGSTVGYLLIRKSAPALAAAPTEQEESSSSSSSSGDKAAPAAKPIVDLSKSGPAPGVYFIMNRKNGKVLDVPAANTASGGEVITFSRNGNPNQQWIVKPFADGTKRLIAFHSFKSLDVRSGAKDDKAGISQWTLNTGVAQKWRFREVGNGFFAIFAECSGKALTALPDVVSNGNAIGQRNYTGQDDQQWRLEPAGTTTAALDEIDPSINPKLAEARSVTVRSTSSTLSPRFVPLDITKVATADSRKGAYSSLTDMRAVNQPQLRGPVEVAGVPFEILDAAKIPSGMDQITLRGGSGHAKQNYPLKVEIPVGNISLVRLHVVGGVAGWGYPFDKADNHLGVLGAKMTVVHTGGVKEEIYLRNGYEMTDHIAGPGVPGSALIQGFATTGQQLRYFAKPILNGTPVEKVVLESFNNHMAPTFFALTAEKR